MIKKTQLLELTDSISITDQRKQIPPTRAIAGRMKKRGE